MSILLRMTGAVPCLTSWCAGPAHDASAVTAALGAQRPARAARPVHSPDEEGTTMTTLPQDELISTPMPGPRARALAERARDAVPRAMSAAMPTFAAATDRGILEDVDGNRLIDFGSGIGV